MTRAIAAQLWTALERAPQVMQSLEALRPHLRSVDLARLARWLPARRITPWPLVAGAFGAGVAVGAGAALLVAPKNGADLRRELTSKLGAFASQARDSFASKRNGQSHDTTSEVELESVESVAQA